jgi:hypothetical protein
MITMFVSRFCVDCSYSGIYCLKCRWFIETSITTKWWKRFYDENGSLLESLRKITPVIFDRIEEAKAQVVKRLNSVLEKKSKLFESTFLVSRKRWKDWT